MDSVIACDLDDVLTQTNLAACQWHNKRFGTTLTLESFHHYEWWKNPGWGSPEETAEKVKEFYASAEFAGLQPVPGAKEGLKKLKSLGFRIAIVTSRSEDQRELTETWLGARFDSLIDSIHYTGEIVTKHSICKELGVVVLIDDSLEHVAACATGEPPLRCIVFGEYAWNQGQVPPGVWRGRDWESVVGGTVFGATGL